LKILELMSRAEAGRAVSLPLRRAAPPRPDLLRYAQVQRSLSACCDLGIRTTYLEGQGTQWVCSFDCAFARRVPEYTSVSAVGSESSVGIVELVYAV
jgi:hypothetical protein